MNTIFINFVKYLILTDYYYYYYYSPHSLRIQENTDQKLRTWTLFSQRQHLLFMEKQKKIIQKIINSKYQLQHRMKN